MTASSKKLVCLCIYAIYSENMEYKEGPIWHSELKTKECQLIDQVSVISSLEPWQLDWIGFFWNSLGQITKGIQFSVLQNRPSTIR